MVVLFEVGHRVEDVKRHVRIQLRNRSRPLDHLGRTVFLLFAGSCEFAWVIDVADGILVLLDQKLHDVNVAKELSIC